MSEGHVQHRLLNVDAPAIRRGVCLVVLCLMFVAAGCGSRDAPTADDVSTSPDGDLSWTTETVTFANGLSHDGDFNAGQGEVANGFLREQLGL